MEEHLRRPAQLLERGGGAHRITLPPGSRTAWSTSTPVTRLRRCPTGGTCACTARRRRRSTRATWPWPASSGRRSATRGDVLVWGGATVGLMGEVARAARVAGGRTIGVIPEALRAIEIADHAADELVVTADMLTRKGELARRADAFVALPGGFGTLEELLEQLTGRLLGFHDKPIVLVDVGGFWQPLLELFEHLYRERFARPESRAAYTVATTVDQVFAALDAPSAGAASGQVALNGRSSAADDAQARRKPVTRIRTARAADRTHHATNATRLTASMTIDARADMTVTSSSRPARPSGTWSTKRGWPAAHARPATARVSRVSVVVYENAERRRVGRTDGTHLAVAARAGGGERVHRAGRQGQPCHLAGRQGRARRRARNRGSDRHRQGCRSRRSCRAR